MQPTLQIRSAFGLIAVTLTMLLAACGSEQIVDVRQAQQQIEAGALVLDVRSDEEWQAGHLSNALHMPIDQFEQRISLLRADPEQAIVVYCQSGGRASHAGKILQQHGFHTVSVLRPGGYAELRAAGLPVEQTKP